MIKRDSADNQTTLREKSSSDHNNKFAYKKYENSHKRQILVVDDNHCMREILSHLLRAMGFNVKVACNGYEGYTKFREELFDLVLTDQNMPGMDGWLLAQKIKGISPSTSIILLTGDDRIEIKKKFKKSEVDFILFKPFDLSNLEETIKHFLEKNIKAHQGFISTGDQQEMRLIAP